jgi:hypothetical protein
MTGEDRPYSRTMPLTIRERRRSARNPLKKQEPGDKGD